MRGAHAIVALAIAGCYAYEPEPARPPPPRPALAAPVRGPVTTSRSAPAPRARSSEAALADWLIPADGCSVHEFGASLAMGRDRLLIAAPAGEDAKADEVPVACVYARSGEGFRLDGVLRPAEPKPGEAFGRAVSVSGSLAVIAAPGREVGAGSAHVFARRASGWAPLARLVAPVSKALKQPERFGVSVAFHDAEILIGSSTVPAPKKGKQSVPNGVVHVYRPKNGGYEHALRVVGNANDASFGSALSIDDQRLAVGADARFVEGDVHAGTASILVSAAGGGFTHVCQLSGAEGGELFGASLSIAGTRLVVGAPHASVRGVVRAGRVDVFTLTARGCARTAVVASPSPRVDGRFGAAVAFDGRRLAIGEPGAGRRGGELAGRLWLLRVDGPAVQVERELGSQASRPGDLLGSAVALGPGIVAAGAPRSGAGYVIAARW